MTSRTLSHIVVLATVVVLVVNGLAGAGMVNNTSPGAVSAWYPTAITPAGYAFSIWSLIYVGVVAFAVYQWRSDVQEDPVLSRVRPWFIASCAANVAWIFSWHYVLIPLSLAWMFALLGTLVMIARALAEVSKGPRFWLAKVPFDIYLGWIVVASTLNTLITTVYLDLGIGDSTVVGAALIVIAAAIGVWLSRHSRSSALPLAMAWGVAAIAVEHRASTVLVAVSLVALLTLIGAAALRARVGMLAKDT